MSRCAKLYQKNINNISFNGTISHYYSIVLSNQLQLLQTTFIRLCRYLHFYIVDCITKDIIGCNFGRLQRCKSSYTRQQYKTSYATRAVNVYQPSRCMCVLSYIVPFTALIYKLYTVRVLQSELFKRKDYNDVYWFSKNIQQI